MALGTTEALSYLPKHAVETDWVLVCADGKELPCSGAVLTILSPVLAGLRETQEGVGTGKIPVPTELSADLAGKFLHWAHLNYFYEALSVKEAKQLAALSHKWDIAGLALHCDGILAKRATEITSLYEPGKTEIFELMEMAAGFGLKETLATCEFNIIGDFERVASDKRLAKVDISSLRRILRGTGQRVNRLMSATYCSRCMIDNRCHNVGVSVQDLQAWAHNK